MINGAGSHDYPKILSVQEIFDGDDYRIPLYQRAYAWTAAEILTLLADIRDSGPAPGQDPRDYYIGSLVVNRVSSDGKGIYEVVDGQQRLTTLFIILSVATRLFRSDDDGGQVPFRSELRFEGRVAAGEDLRRLKSDGLDAIKRLATDEIKHAADLIERASKRAEDSRAESAEPLQGEVFSAGDFEYMLKHVKILRTELPPGTDLNHYFEVMNTRGEQLEKHEILKAKLISALNDAEERSAFARLWDACAVMDRNVQTQFSPTKLKGQGESERSRIFSAEWNTFLPSDADELFTAVAVPNLENVGIDSDASDGPSPADQSRLLLTDILDRDERRQHNQNEEPDEDVESGTYGAIIDFPNLLLHVLKIQQRESMTWEDLGTDDEDRVRLEDKYLLAEFRGVESAIRKGRGEGALRTWVREFVLLLLKTRYLMDTYVIRTQATTPAADEDVNWVVHRAYKYTSPRQSGKSDRNQLNAKSTFGSNDSTDGSFDTKRLQRQVVMLQAMFQVTDTRRASKYFLFRILEWLHWQEEPGEVNGTAFVQRLESMARDRLQALNFEKVLDKGTQVPNFVFNILDYQLWRLASVAGASDAEQLLGKQSAADLKSNAADFRFSYRTSVEHFYPTLPSIEQGHQPLRDNIGERFGNLCIMTRSENSRRNNLMPVAKANQFKDTDESLKFLLMAAMTRRGKKDWNETEINEHGQAMRQVLLRAAQE